MLCEQCGENEATVHLTTISNGQIKKRHLCSKCAAKLKIPNLFSAFSVNSLFDGFMKAPSELPPAEVALKCPQCGMTLQEFREKGKLGCAGCYRAMEPVLLPIIKKVQGSVQHVGKAPEGNQTYQRQREIDDMKQQLNEAVRKEDYEQAAVLRDRIKALETEAKTHG